MKLYLFVLILSICSVSCTKEFLDKKPDKKLIIPSSVEDYQALLDDDAMFDNGPFWTEWESDNFYLNDANYLRLQPIPRNAYTWNKDILEGQQDPVWYEPYQQVFVANLALDGIKELLENGKTTDAKSNPTKAIALYLRAEAFFNLAQLYCKPYDKSTASQDSGIPLRLSSDLNEQSVRSTVQETYDRILTDLGQAAELLTSNVNFTYKNRPSKASAYGLLARVYLSMSDYEKSTLYADQCLQIHNSLIDFNTLDPALSTRTFAQLNVNPELLIVSFLTSMVSFNNRIYVDSNLYNSYSSDDLRRTVYFKNAPGGAKYFVGQYTGDIFLQNGVTTSEMYLIRAECKARLNDKDAALADLNTLMQKRWSNTVPYPTFVANDAAEALGIILNERRKELCFRGLRWTDLRRLNPDPLFQKTLTRTVNGQTYSLPPNDPKYVLQIPDIEIRLSGIQQNPR